MAWKRWTVRRAAVFAAGTLFFFIAGPRPPALWIGLAIVLGGEALRLWAAGHLVKNRSLSRSGPYAHVRNPLYLGTLLILIGFCIAGSDTRAPAVYVPAALMPASLLAFFIYYLPYKRLVEEDRLIRRFGHEAEAYIALVPPFVPRLRPAPTGATARWALERLTQNSEHLTAIAVVTGAIILVLKAQSSRI